MKPLLLCFFALLIANKGVSRSHQSDTVTLVDAVEYLAVKHQIKFAFDHSALENQKLVWNADSLGLPESLDFLFARFDYHYEIQDSVVLIIPNRVEVNKDIAITGVVLDRLTGEPLPHATVMLPGSGKYTITNQDGKFSFVKVPYDTSAIVVQYLGYNLQKLTAKDFESPHRMDIQMNAASEYLEDIEINDLAYKVVKINETPSHISLDLKEFNGITNFGEPDVFRSVQLLPGISATNETSSGLVIRGGTPQQNLVLFDGFTVYHLDHFFGIYSAFNSNVIKDVQLYKSGYGARWGTRVSGVMDITGKSGNTNRLSGNVGLNLLSANATLEIPVSKKTSVVLAARRAYTDVIQSSLYNKIFNNLKSRNESDNPEEDPNSTHQSLQSDFYFFDVNAKVTHRLSEKDVIQLSYYQGKDDLNQKDRFTFEFDEPDYYFLQDILTDEHSEWGNKGGSISYGRQWNDKWYTKAVFSGSTFFKNIDYLQEYEIYEVQGSGMDTTAIENYFSYTYPFRNENLINEYNLKLENEYKINDKHIVNAGLFSVNSHVKYQNFYESSLDDTDLNINDRGNLKGIFGQYSFIPNEDLWLTAGFRATDYSLKSGIYLEPRFSLKYRFSPLFLMKAAYGKYYQFVVNIDSTDPTLNGGDFWLMGGEEDVPILESNHLVLGMSLNHHLFDLDVEGFYKKTYGLANYAYFYTIEGDIDELFFTGENRVIGMDVMVKKNVGNYTGWVAYSLSENMNKFDGMNNNRWFANDFDERHELKWVNLLKLKNWEFSMTWIYGSGKPYSLSGRQNYADSVFFDITTNLDNPNSERIPSYHKLDIGISYIQKLRFGQMRYGLNLLNVYNRRNIRSIREIPISYDVESDSYETYLQKVELLGFTPSIFLNFSF